VNALTEGAIDVFALERAEHTVTVSVFAFRTAHRTGEKRASGEARDSNRSIRRAAAIDDEKAIRLHLAVRSRKFLDAKHLVETDDTGAQNARRPTFDGRHLSGGHCCRLRQSCG
jgi:hypothetical protein